MPFQIDPSIPLQARGIKTQTLDPYELQQRELTLKKLGYDLKSAEAGFQDEQAARQKQKAVLDAITRAGSIEAALPELQRIDPKVAMDAMTFLEQQRGRQLDVRIKEAGETRAGAKETRDVESHGLDMQGKRDTAARATASEQRAAEEFAAKKNVGFATGDEAAFQGFYQSYLAENKLPRSAVNELTARQQFAAGKHVPVKGTDVPLPADVAAQRAQIAAAGRAPQLPQSPVAVVGPDGKPVYVPPGESYGKQPVVSSQNRPPTEGERTALRFYERMKGAVDDLAKVDDAIQQKGLGGQAYLKIAPNFMQTREGQLYFQAQRAFTEARLRKDSGAAIPEQEYENDRQTYFVQPGDKPETVAQKIHAREIALNALRRSAARAYEETYGESPAKMDVPGQGGIVRMVGKDGVEWDVPTANVAIFEKNGYLRK